MMTRPEIIEPKPGQESAWSYPRPPALVDADKAVRIVARGTVIAETRSPKLVKETSHPPVYFLPPESVALSHLRRTSRMSFCEWKGQAAYYDVVLDDEILESAAFVYDSPLPAFRAIAGWFSFYAGPMDEVTVDGELVTPQEGGFYSGWITQDVVGPFKGAPGTWGW